MERPRGEELIVERQLTGEMVYIHDCWEAGLEFREFTSLPAAARQMYEERAATIGAQNEKHPILTMFEHYDKERSMLGRSCEALVEELLRSSPDYVEEIYIAALPREALEELRALAAGRLLIADNSQLAVPLFEGDRDDLDIRKSNSLLTDVAMRVWRDSVHRKSAVTSEPDVEPRFPADFLPYPIDEKSYRSQIDVIFSYHNLEAEQPFTETISLIVDEFGRVDVMRDMYVGGFSFASSEGVYARQMPEDTPEDDIAAFADYIAKLVGDEPVSMRDREDDGLVYAIKRIPDQLSRSYIQEWIDNTSPGHVRALLMGRLGATGNSLLDDLMNTTNSAAREALEELVNRDRAQHLERYRAAEQSGVAIEPWRDRIVRLAE